MAHYSAIPAAVLADKAAAFSKIQGHLGLGEHGSVFALGEHIDVDLITYMMVGLIVFTILFEVAVHKLEHYVSDNPVQLEALLKVFKELTILGFISFILLLIHEFVHIPFHQHLVFEFAHVWIFFVALVFIVHAIIFMTALASSEKKFKVYDGTKHENKVLEEPSFKNYLLGPSESQAALSYHCASEIFRTHNKLPASFDFRKYISAFSADCIVELLDTTELTWGLIIILFLLNLGRNKLVDYMNGTSEDPAAEMAAADAAEHGAAPDEHAAAPAAADEHSAAADASATPAKLFLQLDAHVGASTMFSLSVHQLEQLLGTHKRSLWTFMIFGWCILFGNGAALIAIRHITMNLIYKGRVTVGRHQDDPIDEEESLLGHDEASMRKALPCSSTKVFRVALEFVVMVQCFYVGLLCILNGRAAYTHFPPPYGLLFLLVMFVPIVINLFVCFPAQLKALAFLSAITEVDHHLLGEVQEYQHGMIVDFQHKVKVWMKESNKSEEAACREIFEACKNDEDEITAKALYSCLVKEGITFKEDQFFTVFKSIDTDDGGTVDRDELTQMLHGASEAEDEAPKKKAAGHGHH